MFSINSTQPQCTGNTDVTALVIKIISSAILVALLAACDNPLSNNSDSNYQQTSFRVNRFNSKAGLEALNPNLYRPAVTVDDSPATMTANADRTQWSGNVALPADRAFVLKINWYYDEVLIAIFEREFEAGSTSITVSSTDYITSGDGLDDDLDGCSNLDALRDPPAPGCINSPVASDPSPVSDHPQINRFLGTWLSGCAERETGTAEHPFGTERMTLANRALTGSTAVFVVQHYATSDCDSPEGHESTKAGLFTLGEDILTSDGVTATAIDFQYASPPELVRDIVWQESNNLYLGLRLDSDSDIRPTALDFVQEFNQKVTDTIKEHQQIFGTWAYINPDKQCAEVMHFEFIGPGDSEDSWSTLSGSHFMGGTYEIGIEPVASNRHSLSYVVRGDNGGPDCAGTDVNGVGMVFNFFVEFVNHENINFYLALADSEPVLRLKRAECGYFSASLNISECVIPSFD